MSMNRAQVDAGGNAIRSQLAGDALMDQRQAVAITTAGDGSWTAEAMLAGIITRSGPGAGYADTPVSVATLIAACPQLSAGDSFSFYVRNTVAQANTVAAGTGWTLGTNTAIAASKVRKYQVTIHSNKASQVYAATTTNASAVVSALTASQVDALQPGMGVTGTGIPANTTVIGVNAAAGTVTLSANATATGTLVALTFFPRATLQGVYSADL